MNGLKKRLLILLLSTASAMAQPNSSWNTQEVLIQVNRELLQGDAHLLKNQTILQNFYDRRQNRPLWLSNRGIKGKKVMQLLEYIKRDATLDPRGYIQKKSKLLTKSLERRHTEQGIIQLELQLTSLYYEFLQHSIYGEIDWQGFQNYLESLKDQKIEANWVQYPLNFDLIALMSKEDIREALQEITPQGYHYKKLVGSLYRLYKVKWQGGWGKLPPFKTLKKGQTSPIVSKLRQRLILSGDYRGCGGKASGNYFDGCLEKAVKRFQRRHGLGTDGSVGRGTRSHLNISVDAKIRKVRLNLDRIKWLPRNTSGRQIVVNIPEYMLHYYKHGREVTQHRVIVGDTKHPTPIFSDTLSYITLNPYWKLPEGIIRREVVPEMLKNPNYIKKHGLEAHETWEENSSVVSLKGLNWSQYLNKENKFPYRLMQPPGPQNALGKIKFKFPNKFSVYLHDTPTKHLFKKSRRAFSHGCIRLSKPLNFLKTISREEPNIEWSTVKSILKRKKKEEIDITNDIPISLVYLTTWVNANNELVFGDDIYRYDKHQRRVIR
jgi:murein L,D-transpeptidase YcbB/YkuD